MHAMFRRIIRLQLVELLARLSNCIQRLSTMALRVHEVALYRHSCRTCSGERKWQYAQRGALYNLFYSP